MRAHCPPAYFAQTAVELLPSRLREHGIEVEELSTRKATPRLLFNLKCTRDRQSIHVHGFLLPSKAFVAVVPSVAKNEVEFGFRIHELLLSFGGLPENAFKKQNPS